MSNRKFTEKYIHVVGQHNTTDICTPSKKDKLAALELYCEIACMLNTPIEKLGIHAQKSTFPNLDRNTHSMEAPEFKFTTTALGPYSLIEWNLNCDDDQFRRHGWISLYARLRNISRKTALREIATQFKIDAQNPHLSPMNNCWEIKQITHSKATSYIDDFTPLLKKLNWKVIHTFDFKGPHEFSIFKVASLENQHGKRALLPLTYWSCSQDSYHFTSWPDLNFGCYPKPYPLSGQDLMEKHPDAKIILTEDLPLAFALNDKFLAQGTPEYLATTWFGGKDALADVDYSPLEDREVIYQPRADHASYLNAEKVKEKCKKVECDSFKVSKVAMFTESFPMQDDQNQSSEIVCPFERYLVDHGKNVLHTPLMDIIQALGDRWQTREYRKWMCEIGLKQEKIRTEKKSLFTPPFMADRISKKEYSTLTLDALLAPENITIIVGDQDGGKSLFTQTLALAMSYEFNVFNFEVQSARDVCYLDAENSRGRIEERSQQILSAYGVTQNTKPKIHIYSGVDNQSENGEEGQLSLFSEYWQNRLLEELPEGAVLVVDNLLTLAEEASNHQKKFKELIDFCRKLSDKEVSVILVHHLGKSGQAIGTKATEALCQNIIEIKDYGKNQQGPGANMTVTFEKCKTYPALKGQSFHAHLPYDSKNPLNGKQWIYVPAEAESPTEVETTDTMPELSDLETRIIEILKQSPVHLKRAAIAYKIGCKSDQLKKPLKKLLESKFITKHGESKQGTKYSAE
ncbi:AAA family ATPase [Maridesulfovibrio sp.]|uniref:AAA family ATPase n=1 Tax=Maridesulfovibrio sp. TaxID=2795000 RepID=UPI002AA5F1FB|nr:AAA family ATPase [Maridesulfovibrio sp.]